MNVVSSCLYLQPLRPLSFSVLTLVLKVAMTVGKPVVYQHVKSMDWVGSLVGVPFVTQALPTVTSTVPMGGNSQINSKTRAYPNSIAPMGTKQTCRIIPDLQFQVLVVGRANTGKTSILQWVCDTMESHKIYWGGEEVCGPNFCPWVWSHCRPG